MTEDPFANACYQNNYLKEVIFRIDFPISIFDPLGNPTREVKLAISQSCPIAEHRNIVTNQFDLSNPIPQVARQESKEHISYSKDRNVQINLSHNYFAITLKSYSTYENLTKVIFEILDPLFEGVEGLLANRIGLRYVNQFDRGGSSDPLNWSGLFHRDVLSIFSFSKGIGNVSQAFSIVECNFDGTMLKAQIGVSNPDYPAVVKKKQFVIDLDGYAFGAFSLQETSEVLPSIHSVIQMFFEKSISDRLRQSMSR